MEGIRSPPLPGNEMTRRYDIEEQGWNLPLEVDWNFQADILRQCIRDAAPFDSGALRKAFDDPKTVVYDQKNKEIVIEVDASHKAWEYARIQDTGGYIPSFDLKTAWRAPWKPPYKKAMRAMIGGAIRFFTRRRGFQIKGHNYITRAIERWLNRLTRGSDRDTYVSWRGGTAGETFGGTHGILSK